MKFGYYERQLELKNNRASFDHVVFDYQVDMDPPLLDREISEHQTSDDSEEMNDDLLVDVNEFFQQDDLFYI